MLRKRNQTNPPTHQKDLAEWFRQETGHTINQSMISKVLSEKYDYLDGLERKKDKQTLQQKKQSSRDWPALKGALFEWQQRMEQKKAIITGDVLKEKARQLWSTLLQYSDIEQPK